MTAVNHILTGAAICLTVRHPAIGLPLAFFSHFVLDALPHYGKEGVSFLQHKLVLIGDISLSLLCLILLPFIMPVPWWYGLSAMFLSYSPDIVWIKYFFRELWEMPIRIGNFAWLALKIQWERPWGWAVELPYGLLVLAFVLKTAIV